MHIIALKADFFQEGEVINHLKKNWKRYASAAAIGAGLGFTAAHMRNQLREKKINAAVQNAKDETLKKAKSQPDKYEQHKAEVHKMIDGISRKDIPEDEMKKHGEYKSPLSNMTRSAIGGVATVGAIDLIRRLRKKKDKGES